MDPALRYRDLVVDDLDEVAALRKRTWGVAYAGIIPLTYLEAMDSVRDATERRSRFPHRAPEAIDMVATSEAGVVGWLSAGLTTLDGSASPAGEVFALYVAPEIQGAGVGSTLLTIACDRLRRAGAADAVLWVIEHNSSARAFYEHHGFAPDGASETDQYDDIAVREVRYRRRLTDASGQV